jgi:hypothetical protein
MREKDRFFAIVPIHEKIALVQGETQDDLNLEIDRVLEKPEIVYPFHNFREGITVIRGRKIKPPSA